MLYGIAYNIFKQNFALTFYFCTCLASSSGQQNEQILPTKKSASATFSAQHLIEYFSVELNDFEPSPNSTLL